MSIKEHMKADKTSTNAKNPAVLVIINKRVKSIYEGVKTILAVSIAPTYYIMCG